MQFVAIESGFELTANGATLLQHRLGDPAIQFGSGTPDITMIRGNYRIEDDCRYEVLPQTFSVSKNHVTFLDAAGNCVISLTINCAAAGFRLAIKAPDGCNRIALNFLAPENEHVWGGGEQMSFLRLNGRRFPIWTSEPGVGRDKSSKLTQLMDADGMAGGDFWTTNYPQPTFLSSHHYACHLESSAYSVMDFTDTRHNRVEVWEGSACFRLTFADDLPQLVGTLSEQFGKPEPLPDWVFEGAIAGLKDGPNSFERLAAIRAAGSAICGLWCEDWVGIRQTSFGRRLFWDWRWSQDRYPELPAQMKKLRDEGMRFLGYVNPYLAIDGSQFVDAKRLGYLALELDCDEPYLVDFGEFDCGIVDFTNPAAADWFADEVIGRQMLDFGISGWMADFGEYLPTDLRLHDGTDGMLAHNLWPVLWAEVNAKAIAKRGQQSDAMFFMRAGFSGVQAHCPLLWAGDQCVDFSRHDGIGTVITAALSSGLVGNAVNHSDLGGYTSLHGVVRTPDLLMRWTELSAFSPVMRTHEGNRPEDNLQIDSSPEILAHFAVMSQIHAALAPYLKYLRGQAQENGLPFQRPMFLHYTDEAGFACCQDQYLLGADLLVAPIITEGASHRSVMIPQTDIWCHLWTGAQIGSGTNEVDAALGFPPVFFRKDSKFAGLFDDIARLREAPNQ